jgi:hypothetical protein
MSNTYLKETLVNAPETSVKVSLQLHREIMRSVRMAEPVRKKAEFYRLIPTLGAAVLPLFTVAVFFYLSQTIDVAPSANPGQGLSQVDTPASPSISSLAQLTEELLVLSKNTSVPEQELRKELERLKSDLERFDFRS